MLTDDCVHLKGFIKEKPLMPDSASCTILCLLSFTRPVEAPLSLSHNSCFGTGLGKTPAAPPSLPLPFVLQARLMILQEALHALTVSVVFVHLKRGNCKWHVLPELKIPQLSVKELISFTLDHPLPRTLWWLFHHCELGGFERVNSASQLTAWRLSQRPLGGFVTFILAFASEVLGPCPSARIHLHFPPSSR